MCAIPGATLACVGEMLSDGGQAWLARQKGGVLKRIIRALSLALLLQASSAVAAQGTDPIRLPVTIIRSNPVTTITVGGQTMQAIVDTGGDVDGTLTLSKEVIESVGGLSLGHVITNDSYGREFTRPRFKIPVATLGGRTFQDVTVVQAPIRAAGEEPPVPNAIGRLFLSQYFVVVDYAGGSITLWPPDTKNPAGSHCGRTPIPMAHTEEERLAVSDFETPSGRVRLGWDTGGSYSVLAETTAEKLQLATALRGPGSPKFYQSKTLAAAGQDVGPLEFAVLPIKISKDVDGMLGRNFFEQHVVCLDYHRREIRVR